MASLYHSRPAMQTERSSPIPDCIDTRRDVYDEKMPLREANGNAQAYNFNSLISCYQSPVAPPSSTPPNIPASILAPQSFESLYRVQTPRQQPRYQRKPRQVNPLYYWPAFRQYRNRQAHKDTQKDKGGVWRRPELEDAFVDAVLLMPHMGRRKFSMGGKLHGRNMLISEYIFVICIAVLGSKEIFRIDNSNDSIEQMGRKQVSSHMQVVKKFFEDLRCFHFLFPAEEKKEPGSTNSDDYYEDEEPESFKSNPILTALAEGRVPEVRPNYDYFSQLLALQSLITVRPKICEVFVSSAEIKIRDDVAYDSHDMPIDQVSFPHLKKYANCDDSPNVLGKDILLHEYTRALDRITSASVKTVTRRWQKDAPAMYDTLDLPTCDEDCLLLEMCTTLELHENAKFPTGSELTGFVEVSLTQPALQNHQWKCVTRLTRPAELHGEDSKPGVYMNESGIHRRGCNDSRNDCDCHTRPRQDIHVPFPAVEWASILSMAVQYPDVEHQNKREKRHDSRTQHDFERPMSKRKRSEDGGDAAAWNRRQPTGSDLICKVAMYQELWSRAPETSQWTRQAIIFWRFNTTNQWYKYNPLFKPAGTSWRWLTINDPMSRYHQQKALVYPSDSAISRDTVVSPTSSVSQHLTTTSLNESFSSTWDNGGGVPQLPTVQTNTGTGLFDSFSSGLVTPPPTASLHGSYSANSFDHNVGANAGVGFLPTSSGSRTSHERHSSIATTVIQSPAYYEGQSAFPDVKSLAADVNHHYMLAGTTTPSLDLSNQLVYENPACDSTNIQGWDMSGLDNWAGTSASASAGAVADWTPQGKVEPAGHSIVWNPTQWNMPAAAPAGSGSSALERGGSPRMMKRRRTLGMEGLAPSTTGW